MTAPTILLGDVVRITANGRTGRVLSRSLHPASGRPRYTVAGNGGRYVSRVELIRSYTLDAVYVQCRRADTRYLLGGDVVGAHQALNVARQALAGAEHAGRDTPDELTAARHRYARALARTPHPETTPMSEMKRHHENAHPEKFAGPAPRPSGRPGTPAVPAIVDETAMMDRINETQRHLAAVRAVDLSTHPHLDELAATMGRHPAGKKIVERTNPQADPMDPRASYVSGKALESLPLHAEDTPDGWTRVGFLVGAHVDAWTLPAPAESIAAGLLAAGISPRGRLRSLASSHDGGRGGCVCEVCVVAAMVEIMAVELPPVDLPGPADDIAARAGEMADIVQAVQDIVAEWSQGSTGPSPAMSAIHRVVNA